MTLNSTFPPMRKYETTLADIKARDADGVFLGGTYTDAHNEFVIAHRDRHWLLRYIEKLEKERDRGKR